MQRKWFVVISMICVLALAVGLVGCMGNAEQQGKDKVTLGYVEWDTEIASTHVVKNVLEEMGYDVEAVSVDAALMWETVGKGDFDAIVAAWLPYTHADYYSEVKDDVENLGPNLDGAKIGLVVPTYVTINSIEELNSVKEKFDTNGDGKGEIIGIEPGAGIMKATDSALSEYSLDFELQDSSSASMVAALKKAVDEDAWVVVTGWSPHWKFANWDLKYLQDPKETYGGEEYIATIARKGLEEDLPEVYAMLDSFYWTPADMEEVMLDINVNNTDPDEAAKKWIDKNREEVDKWTSS